MDDIDFSNFVFCGFFPPNIRQHGYGLAKKN